MKAIKLALSIGLLAVFTLSIASCGTLNPKTEGQLKSALDDQGGKLQKCYKSGLKRNRNIKGTMVVVFEVDKDSGKASKAKVKKTKIKDKTMKKCVAKVVNKVKLPDAPGKHVKGEYKIKFKFE